MTAPCPMGLRLDQPTSRWMRLHQAIDHARKTMPAPIAGVIRDELQFAANSPTLVNETRIDGLVDAVLAWPGCGMSAAMWDDEPADQHPLTCNVWTSNRPCNCGRGDDDQTTADRLDALYPDEVAS